MENDESDGVGSVPGTNRHNNITCNNPHINCSTLLQHKSTTHSYVHELPSRCKKDMLAVADKNKDGRIPVEGIETLLRNIGASDRMSRAEIETILCEEGESHAKVIERSKLAAL